MTEQQEKILVEFFVYLPILLVLFGLTFAILVDAYISRRNRRLMLLILALTLCLAVQNGLDYLLGMYLVNVPLRTCISVFSYSVRPVILLLFLYIVGMKRGAWPFWVLTAVNALIHLTALYTPFICFGFPGNHFYRGPLGYTSFVVSGILLAYLLYRTILEYSRVKRTDIWIPVVNALLVVAAIMMDITVFRQLAAPASCLMVTMVCCTLFYYIWLHLQYVREHEEDLKAQQRIKLMLSQIRPHFLYNSLGAIEELCGSDPRAAKEATVKFAQYLRGNMESLEQEGRIPFEKELAHTRLYLELEQLRFEDALQVEYDIACTGFAIPPLTLEPIAENAVRHGVRGKADGRGKVTISTREYADRWEVWVADDGPGFAPGNMAENGNHVGVRNVRERLRAICGGTMRIEAAEGGGTLVRLQLPKKGEE